VTDQDSQKREAAVAALAEVQDGMVLGLGTGSTAAIFVDLLGARIREGGLRVTGVPTSDRTAEQARRLGIPLAALGDCGALDLVVDGADEVDTGSLALVKGLGGALLREKLVALAGRRMVVIVDEGKLVTGLGRGPVPVEIVAFGAATTLARLRAAGADPHLRHGKDGAPYRTDGGNLIADCRFAAIPDPAVLHGRLKALTGVVETGIFPGGLASCVIVGAAGGPRVLERP
jgi:ribose 5-phosphate isomerase A